MTERQQCREKAGAGDGKILKREAVAAGDHVGVRLRGLEIPVVKLHHVATIGIRRRHRSRKEVASFPPRQYAVPH